MRKLTALLLIVVLAGGCKKTVEKIQQDLVLQAMTDGYWAITDFRQDATDITSEFAGYTFKYYNNKTVDAIKNGTVEITGTWDGDADNMTTSANFANAPWPLYMINGTWHIDNNSWTYVLASQTVGPSRRLMRLDKQ